MCLCVCVCWRVWGGFEVWGSGGLEWCCMLVGSFRSLIIGCVDLFSGGRRIRMGLHEWFEVGWRRVMSASLSLRPDQVAPCGTMLGASVLKS